jgi:hypothetical protein
MCRFLGIREPSQLEAHPLRGSYIETYVVAEFVRTHSNWGTRVQLHFWRDTNSNEVEVIADVGARRKALDINSGQALNRDSLASPDRWVLLAGVKVATPTPIYG